MVASPSGFNDHYNTMTQICHMDEKNKHTCFSEILATSGAACKDQDQSTYIKRVYPIPQLCFELNTNVTI